MSSFLDSIVGSGSSSNFVAVNDDSIANYEQEYRLIIQDVDALLEKTDPVSTPYDSKYKARDILKPFRQKLEALNVISQVEGSKSELLGMSPSSIVKIVIKYFFNEGKVKDYISSIGIKLGTIAYEVEELHEAEIELSTSANFYFPGFVDTIQSMTKKSEENSSTEEDEEFDESSWQPPQIENWKHSPGSAIDALKCLNMLGKLSLCTVSYSR